MSFPAQNSSFFPVDYTATLRNVPGGRFALRWTTVQGDPTNQVIKEINQRVYVFAGRLVIPGKADVPKEQETISFQLVYNFKDVQLPYKPGGEGRLTGTMQLGSSENSLNAYRFWTYKIDQMQRIITFTITIPRCKLQRGAGTTMSFQIGVDDCNCTFCETALRQSGCCSFVADQTCICVKRDIYCV